MIVLAEKKDLAPIVQYQETDSFACRILCIANMYGNYPFADFWIQKQEETGHPTAYLSKMDGVITLFAHENADFGELCMFIKTRFKYRNLSPFIWICLIEYVMEEQRQ